MGKDFEIILNEIEKINKSLDKLQKLIPKANDEELKQIYVFMEYLEREYKILQIIIFDEERDRKL